MLNLKSIGIGVAVLSATAVMGSVAPAQAAALVGQVDITGNSNTTVTGSGASKKYFIDFQLVDNIDTMPVFSNFLPSLSVPAPNTPIPYINGLQVVDIKDLTLTRVGATGDIYTSPAVIKFLNFGQRTLGSNVGTLTFDLDASTWQATGTSVKSQVSTPGLPGITGTWKFNGNTIAEGYISANEIFDKGTFGITIASVPEPLTMLGVGTALGFGGFFKRQISKKQKKDQK